MWAFVAVQIWVIKETYDVTAVISQATWVRLYPNMLRLKLAFIGGILKAISQSLLCHSACLFGNLSLELKVFSLGITFSNKREAPVGLCRQKWNKSSLFSLQIHLAVFLGLWGLLSRVLVTKRKTTSEKWQKTRVGTRPYLCGVAFMWQYLPASLSSAFIIEQLHHCGPRRAFLFLCMEVESFCCLQAWVSNFPFPMPANRTESKV